MIVSVCSASLRCVNRAERRDRRRHLREQCRVRAELSRMRIVSRLRDKDRARCERARDELRRERELAREFRARVITRNIPKRARGDAIAQVQRSRALDPHAFAKRVRVAREGERVERCAPARGVAARVSWPNEIAELPRH